MKKLRESQLFRYVMTGGMTTVINYIIYFALHAVKADYITANCAAWTGAVVFAFFANRQMVFHSKGCKRRELVQFFSLRLLTLTAETVCLYAAVELAGLDSAVSKIAVSVMTTILNYLACKYSIFKERRVYHE